MTAFPAIGHVALTVTDLPASARWYQRLFGVEPVLDEDAGGYHHVVFALGGTLIGLHGHPSTARGRSVRRAAGGPGPRRLRLRRPGRVGGVGAPARRAGLPCSPIGDASYGSGLSFRDPDNIALEFFAPSAQGDAA